MSPGLSGEVLLCFGDAGGGKMLTEFVPQEGIASQAKLLRLAEDRAYGIG